MLSLKKYPCSFANVFWLWNSFEFQKRESSCNIFLFIQCSGTCNTKRARQSAFFYIRFQRKEQKTTCSVKSRLSTGRQWKLNTKLFFICLSRTIIEHGPHCKYLLGNRNRWETAGWLGQKQLESLETIFKEKTVWKWKSAFFQASLPQIVTDFIRKNICLKCHTSQNIWYKKNKEQKIPIL